MGHNIYHPGGLALSGEFIGKFLNHYLLGNVGKSVRVKRFISEPIKTSNIFDQILYISKPISQSNIWFCICATDESCTFTKITLNNPEGKICRSRASIRVVKALSNLKACTFVNV